MCFFVSNDLAALYRSGNGECGFIVGVHGLPKVNLVGHSCRGRAVHIVVFAAVLQLVVLPASRLL